MKTTRHPLKHPMLFGAMSLVGGLVWLVVLAFWVWLFGTGVISVQSGSYSDLLIPGFIIVGVLAMLMLMPGLILTVSAGYLFGLVKGLLYVVIASTLGATLAFVLGRKIFKKRLLAYLDDRHPLLFSLNDDLHDKGGLVIFLTRLIPFFPFKLSNYYFGAAGYRLRGFVVGTMLGIIPISALNVTLGVAIAQYGDSSLAHTVTQPWWAITGSVAALASLIGIVSYHARRSLDSLRQKNQHSNRSREHDNV